MELRPPRMGPIPAPAATYHSSGCAAAFYGPGRRAASSWHVCDGSVRTGTRGRGERRVNKHGKPRVACWLRGCVRTHVYVNIRYSVAPVYNWQLERGRVRHRGLGRMAFGARQPIHSVHFARLFLGASLPLSPLCCASLYLCAVCCVPLYCPCPCPWRRDASIVFFLFKNCFCFFFLLASCGCGGEGNMRERGGRVGML